MSQNKKYKKNKAAESISADDAMSIAQGIKQENQTKSQTKLIAQGIRKGIDLYKNQQNKKQRDINKRKKRQIKDKLNNQDADTHSSQEQAHRFFYKAVVPWLLLILSWLFFLIYGFLK